MKHAPTKDGHSRYKDREHGADFHEHEVTRKEKAGYACNECVFQKESGPIIQQFSGEQPNQDYCACSNRKEVASRIKESENSHRCHPLRVSARQSLYTSQIL